MGTLATSRAAAAALDLCRRGGSTMFQEWWHWLFAKIKNSSHAQSIKVKVINYKIRCDTVATVQMHIYVEAFGRYQHAVNNNACLAYSVCNIRIPLKSA